MGDQLFPHILEGIPFDGVVHKEMAVHRAKDGTFVEIEGLTEKGTSQGRNRFVGALTIKILIFMAGFGL